MFFSYPKGEPRFFGGGSSAPGELTALKELQLRVAAKDRPRIERDIRALEAGIRGEERVRFELANSHLSICVIQDLRLEHGGLAAQIDFLVITPYACLVLECKNLYGDIAIGPDGSFTRKAWGRLEGIYSPVTQNERHLGLMREVLLSERGGLKRLVTERFFSDNYRSLVVLANDETVLRAEGAPEAVRGLVVKRDALIARIKEMDAARRRALEPALSPGEMEDIAQRWVARSVERKVDLAGRYELAPEPATTAAARSGADAKLALAPSADDPVPPLCPRCGSAMVLRIAAKGARKGKRFWGCSRYPRCRGIVNIG